MTEYSGEIRPLSTDLSILKNLKLEKQPVGVKFLFKKPEGVKKLEKELAMCLMTEEAQNSGAFYADKTNFRCAEPLFLGFNDGSPSGLSGQIGTREGLDIFQEARANRRIFDQLPTLKKGSCNYVIVAPMNDMDFDPDVLVITSNARQAEIVLRSYTYSTGALYVSKTTPVVGCAWTFIYPFISGELNYITQGLCFGHIARRVGKDGEVTISIPFNLLKTMIGNLQEMTWVLPSYNDGREAYDKRIKEVAGRG